VRRSRRTVLGVAVAFVASSTVTGIVVAQAPSDGKLPRVGILSPASEPSTPVFAGFRKGLRDLGYIDGENIKIEYRFGAGSFATLPALAEQLVRLPVDVIVTDGGDPVAKIAAVASAGKIPIVMATGVAPVAIGLASSYAHPGGNVTGVTLLSPELSAKRLQFLREAFPGPTKVAIIWYPASAAESFKATVAAARDLGVELLPLAVDAPEGLEPAVHSAMGAGVQAFAFLPAAMFWNERARIVALIAKTGLPAIYPEREYADAGGVLAYGPNVPDNFRRAAGFVVKILKGAKPGDLPIEQPVTFDLVVNLRAAKALGLQITLSILVRASEVIE
jgi:putative tryptophan/tyrosine transport system substrate-binding protein